MVKNVDFAVGVAIELGFSPDIGKTGTPVEEIYTRLPIGFRQMWEDMEKQYDDCKFDDVKTLTRAYWRYVNFVAMMRNLGPS